MKRLVKNLIQCVATVLIVIGTLGIICIIDDMLIILSTMIN